MAGQASTSIVIDIDTNKAVSNLNDLSMRAEKLYETMSKFGSEKFLEEEYKGLKSGIEALVKSAENAKTTFEKITLFTKMDALVESADKYNAKVREFNSNLNETDKKLEEISSISFKVDNIEFSNRKGIQNQLKSLQDLCEKESKKIKLNIGVEDVLPKQIKNVVDNYKKSLKEEIKKQIDSGNFEATIPLLYEYKVASKGFDGRNNQFKEFDEESIKSFSSIKKSELITIYKDMTDDQIKQIQNLWKTSANNLDLSEGIAIVNSKLSEAAGKIKVGSSGANGKGLVLVDNSVADNAGDQIKELKDRLIKEYEALSEVIDEKNNEAQKKAQKISNSIVDIMKQIYSLDPKYANFKDIPEEIVNRNINEKRVFELSNLSKNDFSMIDVSTDNIDYAIADYQTLLELITNIKDVKSVLPKSDFDTFIKENGIDISKINAQFKELYTYISKDDNALKELETNIMSAKGFQDLVGEVFGSQHILPEFKGTGTGSGTGSGSGDSDYNNSDVEALKARLTETQTEAEKLKTALDSANTELEKLKGLSSQSENDDNKITTLTAQVNELTQKLTSAEEKKKALESQIASSGSMNNSSGSVQLGEGEQVAKTSDLEAIKILSDSIKNLQDRMSKAEEILKEVPQGMDGLKKLSSQIEKMSGNFNEDGSIKGMGISAEALSEQLKNLDAEFDARITKKIEELEKKSYKENQPKKKFKLAESVKSLKVVAEQATPKVEAQQVNIDIKSAQQDAAVKTEETTKELYKETEEYKTLSKAVQEYNALTSQKLDATAYDARIERLQKMQALVISIIETVEKYEGKASELSALTLKSKNGNIGIQDTVRLDELMSKLKAGEAKNVSKKEEAVQLKQDAQKYVDVVRDYNNKFQSIISQKVSSGKQFNSMKQQLNDLSNSIDAIMDKYNKLKGQDFYSADFAKYGNELWSKVKDASLDLNEITKYTKHEQEILNIQLKYSESLQRQKKEQDAVAEAARKKAEAEKEAVKAAEEAENKMSVAEKSREEQKRKALERQAVQSGTQNIVSSDNSADTSPADNTTLSAILTEVKSINGKMDTSATKAGNNASPNISANQSPNNTPSSVTTPSISSEVQAASEAATAEVAAFKTIDDAVTGLTGDINTKTEAIRAEATEMTNAAKSEVESISLIKQAVSDLATQIHNVPKVRIVGENDGKLNISANLTEEQIAVIREKLKAVFSGEQAIPISFVPNVEGLKQQIADALKNVPVEITNNNINKVIKVNKFKANSDGVEALRNSISSQLKNVKIQSFDATTAAESVKETLSKVLDGVGLKFDTEKLGNEVREAVNSGVEAASAEQKPETSDNKAVRFKEKATNDIGKLRDKYTDKLQGQQLEVFKEHLNEIDNKIKEIKDDASNYTDENAQVIDKDIKQIESLVNSFKEINNSEDKINSLIQKLKDSKNNIERRGAVAQPVVNNINSEMSALEELKRSGQNLNVGNPAEVQAFIDKLHEADATVESLQQSAKDIRISTNATASVAKLDSKFNDLLFKVDKFRRDNSKITSDKGISAQFDSLMRSIQTIEKSDVNFQRLRAQFDQLKATVQGKGLTGRSLGDELKYIAEKIGIKAMLGNSIYRVIGAFRQMVGIVTELDTGMTTLRRVTEDTEATYRKFLKTAGDEAHELGSTVSGLVDSTGDFARLGYNIQEANALAKNAVMYSNVGWLDIQTATADMTSTMKAFNIEASDSIRIVDTFDILGKKLPLVTISVKGWRHSRPSKDIVNHNICVTTAGGVW